MSMLILHEPLWHTSIITITGAMNAQLKCLSGLSQHLYKERLFRGHGILSTLPKVHAPSVSVIYSTMSGFFRVCCWYIQSTHAVLYPYCQVSSGSANPSGRLSAPIYIKGVPTHNSSRQYPVRTHTYMGISQIWKVQLKDSYHSWLL